MGRVQSRLAGGEVAGKWQWVDESVYNFGGMCPSGNEVAGDGY